MVHCCSVGGAVAAVAVYVLVGDGASARRAGLSRCGGGGGVAGGDTALALRPSGSVACWVGGGGGGGADDGGAWVSVEDAVGGAGFTSFQLAGNFSLKFYDG